MQYQHRIKHTDGTAIYHCITRTVNCEMLFDENAKQMLQKHLHQVAEFSGVEIITYALMTNHLHVLVRVPPQQNLSDAELLRRYKVLYPQPTKWATAQIEILETLFKENGPEAEKLRKRLLARMGDISQFMKTLKQRFSIWFNRTHKRFGTLWAERFTSTIVEGNRHFALQMVAAYIDLNPVRAGMVKDPKDYRWCGYGEAEAIGGKILAGLRHAVAASELLDDAHLLATYRLGLFGKGAAPKHGGAKSARVSREDLEKVMQAGGKLGSAERLRLKMRWFSRGGVIGGQEFVQKYLTAYRAKTKRRTRISPRAFTNDSNDAWSAIHSMRGTH
jgi:REP element-mobilizing transposase RayT